MPVVEIEILGRRYSLRSERPPEHLHAVAAYVDERLLEVSGGRPTLVQRDHAILAALNIASELFLLRDRSEHLARSVDRGLQTVLALVDRAVGEGEPHAAAVPPPEAAPS
jgi:cell division protein ZapA (FtsZ GTPase activity inhibitor)